MGTLSTITIKVSFFKQNCTIVFDSKSAIGVIVDPGDEAARILEAVELHKISIQAIWLTHGHMDHAGAAMEVKKALGVNIIGPHHADESLLHNIESHAQKEKIPGNLKNCFVDRYLRDGETVSFGDHNFNVLHCPGHTPGHVVYYSPQNKFAFTGDVLFHNTIGATHFPESNHDLLMQSIREKILPLDDATTFICGHGSGSTIGQEKKSNPFLQINKI